MFVEPCDSLEIESMITLLKAKKSTGHDDLSTWILKQISPCIITPLCDLINQSLQSGIVPNSIKIAKIIPIYKSKNKCEVKNYRPISLLPAISKLIERVMYKRLYKFIMKDLFNSQYGFRNKHSTINAITELVGDVVEAFDNKQYTLACFLDLSKAFYTIDHDIMLKN